MKKVFTISIDTELFLKLDTMSKVTGIPRSRLVSDAVAELLGNNQPEEEQA